MKKHEMEHLLPPAVVETGNYQVMFFIVLFGEFNCKSKEKKGDILNGFCFYLSFSKPLFLHFSPILYSKLLACNFQISGTFSQYP